MVVGGISPQSEVSEFAVADAQGCIGVHDGPVAGTPESRQRRTTNEFTPEAVWRS